MATMTYLEAIRDGLLTEMRRDPRVFVIGEDVGAYGGAFGVTRGFLEEFGPWRVIDGPLAETANVGAGIGAAVLGMRPVVGAYGGAFGVTRGFLEEFGPWRVIDGPLAETANVGAGIGAAVLGMRPVV